jgi:hypothetical protein
MVGIRAMAIKVLPSQYGSDAGIEINFPTHICSQPKGHPGRKVRKGYQSIHDKSKRNHRMREDNAHLGTMNYKTGL